MVSKIMISFKTPRTQQKLYYYRYKNISQTEKKNISLNFPTKILPDNVDRGKPEGDILFRIFDS